MPASQPDPTIARALAAHGKLAEELTGVELLALFEAKAAKLRAEQKRVLGENAERAGRAASLAIRYGQEARQRYTEALAHTRGTHNPVDLEDIWARGDTAAAERARFEARNTEPPPAVA